MRRRTKTQDSFPSPKAAEKVLYLRNKERNDNWSNRRMRALRKQSPICKKSLWIFTVQRKKNNQKNGRRPGRITRQLPQGREADIIYVAVPPNLFWVYVEGSFLSPKKCGMHNKGQLKKLS